MPLTIVVDSMTGLGKKFALKLLKEVYDIDQVPLAIQSPILLVTRSINFGEIPQTTNDFLMLHASKVVGVVVGGNRSWGKTFGGAGDKIEALYHIPLIEKFEGVGFPHQVKKVMDWIEMYEKK
jgi:ribonucleoside-diphosphate reductase protein NrdI